ncbi:MAG TPA: hypothetical protein VGE52_04765, partial [Pirellulales bacterium]
MLSLLRSKLTAAALFAATVAAFGLARPSASFAEIGPAPATRHYGWAGEQAAAQARAALGNEIIPFAATAREYKAVGEGRICLWHFMQTAHQGDHLHNIPQQVGDCVSWGFGHACEYSQAVHWAVSGGEDRVFREAFKPYLYGTGRVFIGRGNLGGDGSTGAWQSRAIEEYGVLPVDAEDCPDYSGTIARRWGAPPGPPRSFVEIAKSHRGECRLVTTWEDACVAISNGCPVAVCSGYGFRVQEKNGRIEGYRSGSWSHCMCFIACDTRRGFEALYCLNSWGPNAHTKAERYEATDGAPPGGFWVLRRDAEGMLSARDSYSVDFTGFDDSVEREERTARLFGWINSHEEGESHARVSESSRESGGVHDGEPGPRTGAADPFVAPVRDGAGDLDAGAILLQRRPLLELPRGVRRLL